MFKSAHKKAFIQFSHHDGFMIAYGKLNFKEERGRGHGFPYTMIYITK